MGAGASSTSHQPLQCPENEDPHKFKKICMLFDSLDRDADMGVNAKEAVNVAETYIQRSIAGLRQAQSTIQKELEHELRMVNDGLTQDLSNAKSRHENTVSAANTDLAKSIESLRAAHALKLQEAKATLNKQTSSAEVRATKEQQRISSNKGAELGRVTGKIQWYESLAPEDKGRVFLKAICGDADGNVGFWKFYEFLKNQDL